MTASVRGAGLDAHRRLFLIAAPLAIAALAVAAPGPSVQIALLLPLVAIVGVPHGALDQRVAEALWPLEGWRGQAAFGLAYLGLAGLVGAGWLLAPGLSLGAFVAYSALHFSDDWHGEAGPLARAGFGAAVVTMPALAFPSEVRWVFGALATPEAAGIVVAGMRGAGLAALAALGVWIVVEGRRRPALVAEAGAVVAAGLLLPPLLYFAVYFCGLHSVRHFLRTAGFLGLSPAQAARAAAPATLLTLGLAAAAAVGWRLGGAPSETVTLRTIFIGLSALTVPHLVLVDRLYRRASH